MNDIFTEKEIQGKRVRSLVWSGDFLVDHAGGGAKYFLDGKQAESKVNWTFSFDAAIVSPSKQYSVIYTLNNTKGLVLKNGKLVREINRSFYFAASYEYPITFAKLKSGKEVLIHCPEEYCQLEVEDIESGERFQAQKERNAIDFFYSRLTTSPNNKWLMSAGWIWHPFDIINLYDIENVETNVEILDAPKIEIPCSWGISSASFLNDKQIYFSTNEENLSDKGIPGQNAIALWEIGKDSIEKVYRHNKPIGTLMPIDDRFVISFFDHPKLIDMDSEEIIKEWKHINSGKQNSSIFEFDKMPPPIAIDPQNARFAVANENKINIVIINMDKLK